MKKLIALALILLCSVPSACAGSVTFSDPLNAYTYTVYNSDGSYVGEYNTTSALLLNSTNDYQVFVKPNVVSITSDPMRGAEIFAAYVPFIFALMLFGLIVICLVILYKRGVRA